MAYKGFINEDKDAEEKNNCYENTHLTRAFFSLYTAWSDGLFMMLLPGKRIQQSNSENHLEPISRTANLEENRKKEKKTKRERETKTVGVSCQQIGRNRILFYTNQSFAEILHTNEIPFGRDISLCCPSKISHPSNIHVWTR